MRTAIATHDGRVSPVLDVAQRLLVVECDGTTIAERHEVPLTGESFTARLRDIQLAGVDVLICGAVSQPLEAALVAAGVQVVSRVCGGIEDVLESYLRGGLTHASFRMPGCRDRWRRRVRHRRRTGRLDEPGEW